MLVFRVVAPRETFSEVRAKSPRACAFGIIFVTLGIGCGEQTLHLDSDSRGPASPAGGSSGGEQSLGGSLPTTTGGSGGSDLAGGGGDFGAGGFGASNAGGTTIGGSTSVTPPDWDGCPSPTCSDDICQRSERCDIPLPFCIEWTKRCAECDSHADCERPLACDPFTRQCKPACQEHFDCEYPESLCDEARGVCVGCVYSSHCGDHHRCWLGACIDCRNDAGICDMLD